MASNGDLPRLGRVKLVDLIPTEGLPTELYKLSVSTLSQSLAQYSAVIIQLPSSDAALLRSCLESSRLYFYHKPPFPDIDTHDVVDDDDSRNWFKSAGYRANTQTWNETYDFRPGLSLNMLDIDIEIPPAGLTDVFAVLGKACRGVLEAVSFYLNLRTLAFNELLDSVPLRSREISASMVSVCCHGRPSFQGARHHSLTADGQLVMFTDHDQNVDRSMLSIVMSDRAGMHVRDFNGNWVLVDTDLGPHEAIVYPGLALYQATAGYIGPAMHRIDLSNLEGAIYGRCSLAFKLMPRFTSILDCTEMKVAGHGVDDQFKAVAVEDFMQIPADQVLNRGGFASFSFPAAPAAQEGSITRPVSQRKKRDRSKPLPPSKRLRLEAQRVLKERVQRIADKKGLKLRFCTLKECEDHIQLLDSPCATIRMEIGWPPGVPFVHPHDLPNKAKIGFLETYEPGWSETNDIE